MEMQNKPYTPLRLRRAIEDMDVDTDLLFTPAKYDAAKQLSYTKMLMRQATKAAHIDENMARWYAHILQQIAAKLRQELRGCDVVLSEACLYLCSMAAEDFARVLQ